MYLHVYVCIQCVYVLATPFTVSLSLPHNCWDKLTIIPVSFYARNIKIPNVLKKCILHFLLSSFR